MIWAYSAGEPAFSPLRYTVKGPTAGASTPNA
jgi:hypothetical protein